MKTSLVGRVFFCGSVLAHLCGTTVQAKKNILFLYADDMRNWTGYQGEHPQAKTPNIDKIAKKGIFFKNAFCPSPVCLPSRTATLTGLRPSTTGITNNEAGFFRDEPFHPLPKGHLTLPLFFQAQGYFTAKGGKVFHSNPQFNDDILSWNKLSQLRGVDSSKNPAKTVHVGGAIWGVSDQTTTETGEWKSAEFIANFLEKGEMKDFFLAYGTQLPHDPWILPEEFTKIYKADTIVVPNILKNDLDDVPNKGWSRGEHAELEAAGKVKDALKAYLESIAFADHCLGRVLDALEKSKYRDSTIVLIMGDHGWHTGQKNHWGKATMWDDATETFLIVYDPTLGVSGVTNQIVNLQDIYPTLIDLTGGVKPTWLEGRSFVDVLKKPNDPAFLGWSLTTFFNNSTLRTNKWAYIKYENKTQELYNMVTDPLQHTNLAVNPTPENVEIMKKMAVDIQLIIDKKDPINTSIYGEYLPPVTDIKPKSALAPLNDAKVYSLNLFKVNGQKVNTFYGKGTDIVQMIHYANHLGLPKGKYFYRILDSKNVLVSEDGIKIDKID